MLVYSLLLSACLLVARSSDPACGSFKKKRGCKKAEYCKWKKKMCVAVPTPSPTSIVSLTEAPTSMRPTTNPTGKPSSIPTLPPTSMRPTTSPSQMPTSLQTPSPTTEPTQTTSPTAEATLTPTSGSNNPGLCAVFDKSTSCTPFVDGNVADDVFEALMGCSNGPNCNAENSGKIDRRSSKFCNHHNEMTDAELVAEEMAIRTALLNSMSSTCDKWCLFDVYSPRGRSWAWDNNSKCWKKQGNRGRCQKMANSPRRTEEVSTVLDRAFGICEVPTFAPSVEFILSTKTESCTEACNRVFPGELSCSADGIKSAHNGRSKFDIEKMFTRVGGIEQCESFVEGTSSDLYPAYDSHNGQCATRHPSAVGNPCEVRPVDNYRLLCPCASWTAIEISRS